MINSKLQMTKKVIFVIITLAIFVGGFAIIFNCATQQTAPEIDPARQKALDDSLHQVYLYEIDKKWSTAYEHYKNKNYRSSIQPFWQVIEIDTIDRWKQKYSLLSDALVKLNKPDSAQIVLELGIKAYPENAHLHRTLAYFLDSRGLIDEAIQQYEVATTIDSSQVRDWKAIGNLYIKTDQLDRAIQAFKKVVELDSLDLDARKTLIKLGMSIGDTETGILEMEKLKEIDPTNTENLFSLGREYLKSNNYENAILNFDEILKLKPGDVTAKEALAQSLQLNGNFKRAIRIYQELMKHHPQNNKILTEIADCYKELNNFQTAARYAFQAHQIDPNYGYVHIVIGEIYEKQAEACYKARGKNFPEYDDKLVFDKAYQEYQKALTDIHFRELAEQKMNYIKDFRPTKEDSFFYKWTVPKDACYDWIFKK